MKITYNEDLHSLEIEVTILGEIYTEVYSRAECLEDVNRQGLYDLFLHAYNEFHSNWDVLPISRETFIDVEDRSIRVK